MIAKEFREPLSSALLVLESFLAQASGLSDSMKKALWIVIS